MLRIKLDELSATDRDRLRSEVAALLLREVIRTPFMNGRRTALLMTPLTTAERARVEEYLAGTWDDTLTYEISSGSLTEYLSELVLRFHEANLPGRPTLRRRARARREAMPQLVAALQRRLVSFVLDGNVPDFGVLPGDHSWMQGDVAAWEQIALGTSRLAQALSVTRSEQGAPEPITVALPSMDAHALSNGARPSIASTYTAPLPRPLEMAPQRDMSGHDRAIFVQLREQLLQSLASAAASYGLTYTPDDPAGLLEGLRVRDAVDPGDLRLAEGILALTARVIQEGRAGLDEYRQALMLYLLFHRGRFARA